MIQKSVVVMSTTDERGRMNVTSVTLTDESEVWGVKPAKPRCMYCTKLYVRYYHSSRGVIAFVWYYRRMLREKKAYDFDIT